MPEAGRQEREVTYHAADRGASCTLGCLILVCFLLGIGMGLWSISGGAGIWKTVVGALALLAGIGLITFLRSPVRGRWEVTFDVDERVIRFYSRVHRQASTEEISFDEVARIALTPIERETSGGEIVAFQLPVIYFKSGREPLRFDERLSIREPQRAEDVLREMNELLRSE
jgi:hypothetical protein